MIKKKYFQVQFMYTLPASVKEAEKTFVDYNYSFTPHGEYLWDLTIGVEHCLKAGSMYMYFRAGSTANIHTLKNHVMKTLKEWNFHNVITDIKVTKMDAFADMNEGLNIEKETIRTLFFHSSNTVGLAIKRNHEQ